MTRIEVNDFNFQFRAYLMYTNLTDNILIRSSQSLHGDFPIGASSSFVHPCVAPLDHIDIKSLSLAYNASTNFLAHLQIQKFSFRNRVRDFLQLHHQHHIICCCVEGYVNLFAFSRIERSIFPHPNEAKKKLSDKIILDEARRQSVQVGLFK